MKFEMRDRAKRELIKQNAYPAAPRSQLKHLANLLPEDRCKKVLRIVEIARLLPNDGVEEFLNIAEVILTMHPPKQVSADKEPPFWHGKPPYVKLPIFPMPWDKKP